MREKKERERKGPTGDLQLYLELQQKRRRGNSVQVTRERKREDGGWDRTEREKEGLCFFVCCLQETATRKKEEKEEEEGKGDPSSQSCSLGDNTDLSLSSLLPERLQTGVGAPFTFSENERAGRDWLQINKGQRPLLLFAAVLSTRPAGSQ